VIVAGVTASDVEMGLERSRHGRTLSELFAAAIPRKDQVKRVWVIAVQGSGRVDEERVGEAVERIFRSVAHAQRVDHDFHSHFSLRVVMVESQDDAEKVSTCTCMMCT
jgi:hypothetical protein